MNKYLYYSGKYLQPGRVNTAALAYVFRKVLRNKLKGRDTIASSQISNS